MPADGVSEFIASVLSTAPRCAVFDCDGTLWDGDAGEEFFYWSIDKGIVPQNIVRPAIHRYAQYKKGNIGESQMCGEMVTLYEGVEEEELAKLARDFFEEKVASRIFPEMLELTRMLEEGRCEVWAVSSTNEWVVRAGAKRFGIPQERVLAACAVCDSGRVTGRLKWVPTGEDKARVIKKVVKREVDLAFGNSIHDAAMLAMAKHAYAINPNPDLEQIAKVHGWVVHKPTR